MQLFRVRVRVRVSKMKLERVLTVAVHFILLWSVLALWCGVLAMFVRTPELDDSPPTAESMKWRFLHQAIRSVRQPEELSSEPRVVLYRNFMSPEECDYLIKYASASPVMVPKHIIHGRRTSFFRTYRYKVVPLGHEMSFARGQKRIMREIEGRIAKFTSIPLECGERLQLVQHKVGDKQEPHHGFIIDAADAKNGGQRVATMVLHLSDVEEGGETIFPVAKANWSNIISEQGELSECAGHGLAIKPRKGDAVLFWNVRPDGTPDPYSLHGSCPVIRGRKWFLIKHMRAAEYVSVLPHFKLSDRGFRDDWW